MAKTRREFTEEENRTAELRLCLRQETAWDEQAVLISQHTYRHYYLSMRRPQRVGKRRDFH